MLQKRTVDTYRNQALVVKDMIEDDMKYRTHEGAFSLTKDEMNHFHKLSVGCVRLAKEHVKLVELVLRSEHDWAAVVAEIATTWAGAKNKPMDLRPHEAIKSVR